MAGAILQQIIYVLVGFLLTRNIHLCKYLNIQTYDELNGRPPHPVVLGVEKIITNIGLLIMLMSIINIVLVVMSDGMVLNRSF
jgi:hypothetical protein